MLPSAAAVAVAVAVAVAAAVAVAVAVEVVEAAEAVVAAPPTLVLLDCSMQMRRESSGTNYSVSLLNWQEFFWVWDGEYYRELTYSQ